MLDRCQHTQNQTTFLHFKNDADGGRKSDGNAHLEKELMTFAPRFSPSFTFTSSS